MVNPKFEAIANDEFSHLISKLHFFSCKPKGNIMNRVKSGGKIRAVKSLALGIPLAVVAAGFKAQTDRRTAEIRKLPFSQQADKVIAAPVNLFVMCRDELTGREERLQVNSPEFTRDNIARYLQNGRCSVIDYNIF